MKLEEIVNKLLAKEPKDRYQNIMELPVDLKSVTLQTATTSQIGSSGIRDTIQREKQLNVKVKYSYKTILTIAVSAILASILTWMFKPDRPSPEPKAANKIVISLPEDISLSFSSYNRMAISPDGKDIVSIAMTSSGEIGLFLKRPGSFDVIELERTRDARAPFFSPDGRWVGYINQRTKEIYKVFGRRW